MKVIFLILVCLSPIFVKSQICLCQDESIDQMPDTEALDFFEFSNGENLKICPPIRYFPEDETDTYFKDFTIETCKNNRMVRYWNYLYCKANFENDTLFITETAKLPVGRNGTFEIVNKSMTMIYFRDTEVVIQHKELPIRKYSLVEIDNAIRDYESALKGKKANIEKLYTSLLVAGLSGSDKAMNYFINFNEDLLSDNEREKYHNLKSTFVPHEY